MGIEYRLRFTSPTPEEVATVLSLLPAISGPGPDGIFEVRVSQREMPDATMRIVRCGAYYCYYGGRGEKCSAS